MPDDFDCIWEKQLNSNIRCIEILVIKYIRVPLDLLNSNIRCIEISVLQAEKEPKVLLNSNIRCIEMSYYAVLHLLYEC